MLLLLSTSAAASLLTITRMPADTNRLFPTNAKKLSRFMMDQTYGIACRPFSAAWVQRGVLDATADSDFFERLSYYHEAQAAGRPRGAIFVAQNGDEICGFADIGASLWLPKDNAFRLPQDPELQRLVSTGTGADGKRKTDIVLVPYVSNVVVDASLRRGGIGRRLMEACEAEAQSWTGVQESGCATDSRCSWLEVSASNQQALNFYKALGYAAPGALENQLLQGTSADRQAIAGIPEVTHGSEVVREGDAFNMLHVERRVLCKVLRS